MKFKSQALKVLLALTLAVPLPSAFLGGTTVAHAEGPLDPAPVITAKVVNENAGKKVLFDNTHGQTAGAADWVIDGAFSDFGNALANNGYYVKELRKTTPITIDDLQAYDVFVIGEANVPYKKSEQDAMLQYVQNGGSIFFVGDHYNADRNKNRWDANEVFNGFRRGAWVNPAKGMSAEEAASAAMQGVQSSDWLGENFGIRFRYNALGDVTANIIAPVDQTFGITAGVDTVAMHAGSTLAIMDPKKAKGLVYVPETNARWGNAVDQGVYNGGGIAEGPYAAISKVGGGKAAFIGDSSPVEDATPKYMREETGKSKTTYDGFKEQDDAKLLVNMVNWLSKKETYTTFDQAGIALDQPTELLAIENPETSTEPQAEPWAAPAAGYKWWDQTTFAPGSFGSTQAPVIAPAYSLQKQDPLPNAEEFQIRVVANMAPFATVSNINLGIYLTGGTQIGQVKNADGTWPTNYGYSTGVSLTADAKGVAHKTLTVRVKPGTTATTANLRLRQGSTALKTETVNLANVPAIPMPEYKPPVPAKITIEQARQTEVGKVVTVEGVITSKPGAFGGQAFYLQDSTAGIYVFQNTAGFNVGDRVIISAETTVYNTEFELTDVVAIEKVGTADVPAPVVVSALSEANQGQLVTLEDATIQNLVAAGSTGTFEFDAVTAAGTTRVRVDSRTGLNLNAFPYKNGNVVSVSGISSIFKGTFQLKPLSLEAFAAEQNAPTTTATLSGTANAAGWYNQDVTVVLTATDDKSGVATTEYGINGAELAAYVDPFVLTEGNNALNYRSTDNNGNVEETKSLTVNIDKTAPVVTFTQSGQDLHNVMIDGKVSFEVAATDNLSGVASRVLLLDDKTIEAGKEISALELGLGVHTVKVRVTDVAGNVTEENYLFVVETSFASINNLLNSLVKAGEVKNNGISTSLTAKLATAEKQFKLGQTAQAKQHLTQLQQILGDYAKVGNVTEHAAEVLGENIEYLLAHDLK